MVVFKCVPVYFQAVRFPNHSFQTATIYMLILSLQFIALQNYRPLAISGSKIKSRAKRYQQWPSTSITNCVCVCDWRHSMKETEVNNGLLTATLLPVICMQRSAEVNVQKDTNSIIVSNRPDNLLKDQTVAFCVAQQTSITERGAHLSPPFNSHPWF